MEGVGPEKAQLSTLDVQRRGSAKLTRVEKGLVWWQAENKLWHPELMPTALEQDLERLSGRAFERADWAEGALRRYHALAQSRGEALTQPLRALYHWMFVPPTLWPFNVQDALEGCVGTLERGKRLTARQQLMIELLPEPPEDSVCEAVAAHELHVQTGTYEDLVKTQAKYSQNELAIRTNTELQRQWKRIKEVFDIDAYRDYKGLVRRSMSVERNLRPSFAVNLRRQAEVFQAAFDAFCLRWNLYGMQHDEPLPLKLSVNLNAFGTMIHIPAYWSFDPKRDICWNALAKLHRVRVQGRQGSALAEGLAERIKAAEKLRDLDLKALRLKLKGQRKHEFLCRGLGWVPETSAKRLRLLRKEFQNHRAAKK